MLDPPRRPRPDALNLLNTYTNTDSVRARDEAWEALAVAAEQATKLLKVQVEVHHICVLIGLSHLTPPAHVTDDTPEDQAPTQPSIGAVTGYGQPHVSAVLGDLHAKLGLVRQLKRPHRHLRPPHRGRDMYWLTPGADRLLTKLFPPRKPTPLTPRRVTGKRQGG